MLIQPVNFIACLVVTSYKYQLDFSAGDPSPPSGGSLYFSMDNKIGTTLVGHGISGTLVGGPTQVAGKVGQALSIGPGQYIDAGVQVTNCAGKIALCNGGLTVAFWFKLMETSWASTFNNNGGMRLFISKSSTSISVDLYCVENGAGNIYSSSTTVSDANDWNHITVSCSTQQIGNMYINGQHRPDAPSSSGFGGTTGELWFGKINSHDRLFYADELVMWFSELSASSVLTHYNIY